MKNKVIKVGVEYAVDASGGRAHRNWVTMAKGKVLERDVAMYSVHKRTMRPIGFRVEVTNVDTLDTSIKVIGAESFRSTWQEEYQKYQQKYDRIAERRERTLINEGSVATLREDLLLYFDVNAFGHDVYLDASDPTICLSLSILTAMVQIAKNQEELIDTLTTQLYG